MSTTLFLTLSALVAEITGTIAGFGSSSIFLPLASQVLDFRNALILVALYHIFGNTSRLMLFCKHVNGRIFLLFGIPSIIATVVGASLVALINPDTLKVALGIVLFLFSGHSLIGHTYRVKATPIFGMIGGGLSGFTAGLIGTGGVLRGAFMSLFRLPKEQYIATIASVALIVDFTRIPLYFKDGFLSPEHVGIIPFLLVIAFVGSYIGRAIVRVVPEKIFRRIILIGIMILSLVFVIQGWNQV